MCVTGYVDFNLKTPLAWARIINAVIGLGIGTLIFYSHFESTWVTEKVYETCSREYWRDKESLEAPPCPGLGMERAGLVLAIPPAFGAAGLLTRAIFGGLYLSSNNKRLLDVGVHALFAVMLAISGTLYIVSVELIQRWYLLDNPLRWEKIATGLVCITGTILYGIIAFLANRERVKEWKDSCNTTSGSNAAF